MAQLLDNRYRILRNLAEGGFGTTFLAEDTRTPSQRRCVVKQLKPNASASDLQVEFNSRFAREAAVLEELGQGHLQIPLLYAYFEENNQFYLVQEYIQGETLTQQVQAHGPWDEGAVRTLLQQLLPVVSYIHDRDIIHRDIKPDNIILREQDGLPVLIDFGAVKDAVGVGRVPTGGLSQSGPVSLVIGTPGFMAPEQGTGRPVFSSDLYALGLTAIYCLTGQFPQDLDSDPHTGQIRWQPARAGIRPALIAVLNRMVAPHPSDRFPRAADILPVLAGPVNPPVPLPTQVVSPGLQNQRTTALGEPTRHIRRKKSPSLLLIVSLFLAIAATSSLVTVLLSNRPEQQSAGTPQAGDVAAPPEPEVAAPQPAPAVTPTPAPTPTSTLDEPTAPTPPTVNITPDIAAETVNSFYDHLSNRNWDAALALTGGSLAQAFSPDFFQQFEQVTVNDLQITTQTADTIELLGQNTYLYPDGTTQEEERTFTVQLIDEQPQIVDSTFVRVTKFR